MLVEGAMGYFMIGTFGGIETMGQVEKLQGFGPIGMAR